MMGFKAFLLETSQLDERIVRTGASLAMAAQSKRHGNNAVRSFRAAQHMFVGYARKSDDQKVDAIANAISHLLDGLISTRHQIGSVSGQIIAK